MADITNSALSSRLGRAGGNACFFGQCGKWHVGNEVLQEEVSWSQISQRGSTLLRGQLQQSRTDGAGRVV